MAQQLKRWESPRRQGRNDKGKGGAARQRQLRKQQQMLRKKLKENNPRRDPHLFFFFGVKYWQNDFYASKRPAKLKAIPT